MPPLHANQHGFSKYQFRIRRINAPTPLVCALELLGFYLQSLFSIVDRLGGTFRHGILRAASPLLDNDLVSEVAAISQDCHLGLQEDPFLTILPAIGTRRLSTHEGFLRAIRRDVKSLRLTSQWERGATLLHEVVKYAFKPPGWFSVPSSRSKGSNFARSLSLQHVHHIFLCRQENPKSDFTALESEFDWWWQQDQGVEGNFDRFQGLRSEYRRALSTPEASEESAFSKRFRVAGILKSLAIRRPLPLYEILQGQDTKDDMMDEFLSLIVERALELGAHVNARDEARRTALIIAAEKGMSKTVAALLEGGSEPELRDDENMTALHHAASNGNLEVVQALIWAKNGYASSGMRDKDGLTPLLHAARNSHRSITEFIIAYAGNDDIMDAEFQFLVHAELREDEQVTALKHLGALWPRLEGYEPPDHPFVTCLKKKKFQLATEFITSDVIGFDYQTSAGVPDLFFADFGFLPLAARSGNRQVVERLLEKHVITMLEFGFSMIVAAMRGYTDILQLLIEDERVKKDTVEENIKRVRQDAERLVATQMVTIDIDNNADDEQMNPFMFAAKYGQQGMASFLAGVRLRGGC